MTPSTGTGKYESLLQRCQSLSPVSTAVAHPCEESALGAAIEAGAKGLITPILVGPAAKIRDLAQKCGIALGTTAIVDAPHSHAAAAKAVELVRKGEAELLMKGSLHTDELLGAVVARETGLRTGRRISHVFIMDVPTYHKVLIVTDAAINIAPTLEDKVDICQNAIDLAVTMGVKKPKVAILAAVETVTSKMAGDHRRRGAVQDGRPRADYKWPARRPARIRQRDQRRGGADQTDRLRRGRRSRHPAGAGPRGRQHAGQAVVAFWPMRTAPGWSSVRACRSS